MITATATATAQSFIHSFIRPSIVVWPFIHPLSMPAKLWPAELGLLCAPHPSSWLCGFASLRLCAVRQQRPMTVARASPVPGQYLRPPLYLAAIHWYPYRPPGLRKCESARPASLLLPSHPTGYYCVHHNRYLPFVPPYSTSLAGPAFPRLPIPLCCTPSPPDDFLLSPRPRRRSRPASTQYCETSSVRPRPPLVLCSASALSPIPLVDACLGAPIIASAPVCPRRPVHRLVCSLACLLAPALVPGERIECPQ